MYYLFVLIYLCPNVKVKVPLINSLLMGIKNLFSKINEYSPNSTKVKNVKEYSGSKIAIDAEILIYKYKFNKYNVKDNKNITSEIVNKITDKIKKSKNEEVDLKNLTTIDHSHSYLYPLINTAVILLKNNITPVYVFDGKPHENKKEFCLSKRLKIKENNMKKINSINEEFKEAKEASDNNDANTDSVNETNIEKIVFDFNDESKILDFVDKILNCQNKILSYEYRTEFKNVLKLLGLPIIYADSDAEQMCVELVHNGLCDYIYTEDSDALVYSIAKYTNAPNANAEYTNKHYKPIKILKTFIKNGGTGGTAGNTNNKKTEYFFTEIDSLKVIYDFNELFKFDSKKFIDFCILCGCDFCEKLPKIGPVKSLKIMTEHDSIEDYLTKNSVGAGLDSVFDYKTARDIFNQKISITDECYYATNLQYIEISNIYEFVNKTKININFINEYIKFHNNKYLHTFSFVLEL